MSQETVKKTNNSLVLVLVCPYSRPWCRPGDGTYGDISCCADYSEATKEKIDCVKLLNLSK